MKKTKLKTEAVAVLEEGKTYWICVGDKDHEPTPTQLNHVNDHLNTKFPEMKWIIAPYYIKPATLKKLKMKNEKKKA